MKIIMLTQNNCSKCLMLKQFLELGLNNKYENEIEVIKREDNEKLFLELVNKHNIMTTPVLIYDNELLVDCTPSNVINFFDNILVK